MADELVEVRTFNGDMLAELARGRLESLGIHALVWKDDVGGMEPQLQLARPVRLLVRPQDAEAAREILGEELGEEDEEDEEKG
jgi:hypothetical protein